MVILDTDIVIDCLSIYQPALDWLDSLKLEGEVCDEALSIFSRYHLSHGIGIFDALIGQTAIALNLPLYTFNQKHYDVIPNLRTVQPYEK